MGQDWMCSLLFSSNHSLAIKIAVISIQTSKTKKEFSMGFWKTIAKIGNAVIEEGMKQRS